MNSVVLFEYLLSENERSCFFFSWMVPQWPRCSTLCCRLHLRWIYILYSFVSSFLEVDMLFYFCIVVSWLRYCRLLFWCGFLFRYCRLLLFWCGFLFRYCRLSLFLCGFLFRYCKLLCLCELQRASVHACVSAHVNERTRAHACPRTYEWRSHDNFPPTTIKHRYTEPYIRNHI